jgi:hypothetical protein
MYRSAPDADTFHSGPSYESACSAQRAGTHLSLVASGLRISYLPIGILPFKEEFILFGRVVHVERATHVDGGTPEQSAADRLLEKLEPTVELHLFYSPDREGIGTIFYGILPGSNPREVVSRRIAEMATEDLTP